MLKNLKLIRVSKDMTQEELAQKSGVSRATICTLETSDEANTKTKTLERLAEALDCSVRDFFIP